MEWVEQHDGHLSWLNRPIGSYLDIKPKSALLWRNEYAGPLDKYLD